MSQALLLNIVILFNDVQLIEQEVFINYHCIYQSITNLEKGTAKNHNNGLAR